MKQYTDLINKILSEGRKRTDRTGTGTISIFGHQTRFDLSRGFPLLTLKKTHFKSIVVELLWFLSGSTNIDFLKYHNVSIWDEWADENGDFGPIYGKQWRSWQGPDKISYDQISSAIDQIKNNPDSRRIIVSAWNVSDLDDMALAPCHTMFQFYVRDGKLDCQLYQRSVDVFLGLPFNIASYSLLTMMIAHLCDLEPGEFIWTGGDCHIYLNHLDQVREMMTREEYPLPTLLVDPTVKHIDDFKLESFKLLDYLYHPAIKAPVAV